MTQQLVEAEKEEHEVRSFANNLGLAPSRTNEKYKTERTSIITTTSVTSKPSCRSFVTGKVETKNVSSESLEIVLQNQNEDFSSDRQYNLKSRKVCTINPANKKHLINSNNFQSNSNNNNNNNTHITFMQQGNICSEETAFDILEEKSNYKNPSWKSSRINRGSAPNYLKSPNDKFLVDFPNKKRKLDNFS